MVRISARVVRVAVFSKVVYIAIQRNVARNAFLDSTTIPQHMTSFELFVLAQICD